MKKFVFVMMIAMIASSMAFAEEKVINFFELTNDQVMVKVNTSQTTFNKKISSDTSGIRVFAERPTVDWAASTMSVVFINGIKVENVAQIKSAKISGVSLGYTATITVYFQTSKGDVKKFTFPKSVPAISGPYDITYDNVSYIDDVKDRNPVLKPVWPFNESDIYITEIEFHLNQSALADYPYNAQKLTSLSLVFDNDTSEGKDLENEFETTFGVENKVKSAMDKRSEELKAEKEEAERIELELQAKEPYYSQTDEKKKDV